MTETRVAVLGASGYAGGELVRLLAAHRRAEVTFLGAKDSAGKTLAESYLGLHSGKEDLDGRLGIRGE